MDGKHRYCLGPDHSCEDVLVEKTALKVRFVSSDGTEIRTFKREYGSEPTETYDMTTMLYSACRKPRSWRNSYARRDMEDGVLKKWLDSLEGNTSDLSSTLYKLSKAAEVFGYADAYTAMEELISKGNRTPSYDDIAATCRRIGQGNSMVPIGSGTVDLSKFDELIKMGKEEENA